MEPFLPQLKVVAPMDMQIAPDGAVYLLAYGTNWFARNTDSGIIRVEYSEGNRNPVASLKIDRTIGAAPLTVALSANDSKDFDDGDKLSYAWKIGSKTVAGKELRHTFSKPGTYNVVLTVSDQNGGKGTATTQVKVGNTPPDVTIATKANRSFYWDNSAFDYQVKVSDKEDGNVDQQRVKVSFNYLPYGKDLAGALTSDGETDLRYASTAKLYASLDCKACHTPETKSIGPALKDIAKRYADKEGADALLARKIITGGSGNWGSYPMPPHADLSEANAKEIAGYILSIGQESQKTLLSNNMKLTEHIGKGSEGAYVLQASYADKGANGIESLKTASHIVLKNPLIQLEDYHEGNVNVVIATKNTGYISYISHITHGKYTRFNAIDLNHIKKIRFRIQEQGIGGTIEMRQGSKDGLLLGSLTVPEGKVADPKTDWKELEMPVTASGGIHDLFFVFKNENKNKKGPLFHVDWMYFEN